MYFAAFNTTAASADYTVATGSSGTENNFTLTAQTTSGNSTLGHTATKLTKNSVIPINMPGLSTVLSANSSITYTILVWLQETGATQNTEQGGQFKAGVNVTTAGNGTGVTGILEGSQQTVCTVNLYDVNATGYNSVWIGQAIPNNITQYTTASSAITALEAAYSAKNSGATASLPFFLKHTIESNTVTESYVGFVVTPAMVTANPGMVAGTYYLKGGDNGVSFLDNAKTLYDAFGGVGCSLDGNNGGNPYTTTPSSYFNCNVLGLNTNANSNGNVNADYNAGSNCKVNEDGNSNCK